MVDPDGDVGRLSRSPPPHIGIAAVSCSIAFCMVVVGYEMALLIVDAAATDQARRLHDVLRVSFGIGGLLAAENLLHNAGEAQRRNLWPLCLALGAIFAY